MKRIFRKGRKFGDWTLATYKGGGGNGEVWSCINSKGDERAIKLLKNVKLKSYRRFKDEAIVIEQNSDIEGIIKIEDKFLPSKINPTVVPYFIMPLAESSEDKLKDANLEDKVEAIIQVAETLSQLHSRNIFHRDIKPANILFLNGRFSLADFGLVEYPNKKEISIKNEEIGAKWTMAPEMRRESSTADVSKADVYSLAKTLWIYLTGHKKGFDGQYSTESIIHLKKFYPDYYTTPIDNLLISCTDNDPSKRPNIDGFLYQLQEWKILSDDFHERNQQQWFEIQTKLFPTSIPQRVIWENINDIVKVLKIVSSYDNLNHVFFPDGGGMDLLDAKLSHEDGCIELDFELIDILKPKRLIFESFGYNHEWNYFRLEADELEPSGIYKYEKGGRVYNREELTQINPGYYKNYDYLENSYYIEDDDYKRPEGMKHITRWFRGCFVIFNKRSIYNRESSTYDGRHNKMNADEFRNYIQKTVDYFKEQETKVENFVENIKDKSYLRQLIRRGESPL